MVSNIKEMEKEDHIRLTKRVVRSGKGSKKDKQGGQRLRTGVIRLPAG